MHEYAYRQIMQNLKSSRDKINKHSYLGCVDKHLMTIGITKAIVLVQSEFLDSVRHSITHAA